MNLDRLLEELEPVSQEGMEGASEAEFETLYDSLAQMLKLAERTAKAGYRAGQSTQHVGEQVIALKKFMEAELEAKKTDLREARSQIGGLKDECDRLVQALMETADLTESAAEAAENELADDAADRFSRLHGHMEKVLNRAGLEPLASQGERFNPEFHEAVDQILDDSAEPRIIVQVVRQGYRYRGDTVRIARVIIAE